MSKTTDYIIEKTESDPQFRAQLEECEDKWWVYEDADKDYQKHCEKLKDDKFVKELDDAF